MTEVLSADVVTGMRHRFKQGDSLTNAEIEDLLWTAEWAIGEMEHILEQEPELYPEIEKP